MKNKITTWLANILHRPFMAFMDGMTARWKKDLPYYENRRAATDGGWNIWPRVCRNTRNLVDIWDRIKSQQKRLEATTREIRAKTERLRAELEKKERESR